ncbi:caspase domain-containing protein [Mycena rosella]|uniref:Caspase domain-containing protein n=1 Tax=Mycena rosella TaxID=1033263 RepID=A0AAD7G3P8_MYCRO|nr:caspase domain-containing protein [Mycena rosella]
MMWDLSGGSHTSTPSVAMPVPSLAVPHGEHRHSRHSSLPGPPSPGWSASGAHTPVPMLVPPSYVNSIVAGSYTYEPTPRGFLHPQRHHHAQASAPPRPHPRRHHNAQPAPLPVMHHHAPMPAVTPHFMYSKCTGRRRALCIGINYRGQPHELRGCINDAKHVFSFLVRRKGYKAEDIVVLTDDSPHARSQPTRQNIIDAMHWLVRDARPHDALFFHYSGHGGQTRDLDGDEVDGYDEVIYPVDYKRHGHIVDDVRFPLLPNFLVADWRAQEMHAIMVKTLAEGCRLTAVFDSCHSGTVLDLPYIYDSHGRLKGRQVSQRARARKATRADVISLSGCKDGQTSADTFAGGMAVGAASHAFIKAIEMHPNQSYQEILHNIRMILHPKFSQKPQLGSSHPIDTSLRFIM